MHANRDMFQISVCVWGRTEGADDEVGRPYLHRNASTDAGTKAIDAWSFAGIQVISLWWSTLMIPIIVLGVNSCTKLFLLFYLEPSFTRFLLPLDE